MRNFKTGATRDKDDGKLDYEGFLSPAVLARYAQFMHRNRIQADGQLRASDNWQKGIPQTAYMQSALRHLMALWLLHRGLEARDEKDNPLNIEDELCAIMFNIMGYLHEELKNELER